MSADIPRFNYITMNDLDGEQAEFPVLHNPEDETGQESGALLEAARIVQANLHQIDGGLVGLIDTVGEILTDPANETGLIIEDEMGGGSVTIDAEDTEIVATYRDDGEWTVATTSFFEMLGALKNAE